MRKYEQGREWHTVTVKSPNTPRKRNHWGVLVMDIRENKRTKRTRQRATADPYRRNYIILGEFAKGLILGGTSPEDCVEIMNTIDPKLITEEHKKTLKKAIKKANEAEKKAATPKEGQKQAAEIIGTTYSKLGVPQESKVIPTGKLQTALYSAIGKKPEKDLTGELGILDGEAAQIVIQKFNEKTRGLRMSTDKIITYAAAQLPNAKNNKVVFSLKDFATQCGYKVTPQQMGDDEQQEKENNRAKNALKECRKKVKEECYLLPDLQATFTEKVKGRDTNFVKMNLFDSTGIVNGQIVITFGQAYAEYLRNLPVTLYNTKMLLMDERDNTSYQILRKINEYANMDLNQILDKANRIKVVNVLDCTSLPTYEEITKGGQSWDFKIKQPFEKALDKLVSVGFLTSWEYCKSGGKELSDSEADFKTFDEWSNALLKFTISNPIDQTERLERKKADRKKAITTAKRKATTAKRQAATA